MSVDAGWDADGGVKVTCHSRISLLSACQKLCLIHVSQPSGHAETHTQRTLRRHAKRKSTRRKSDSRPKIRKSTRIRSGLSQTAVATVVNVGWSGPLRSGEVGCTLALATPAAHLRAGGDLWRAYVNGVSSCVDTQDAVTTLLRTVRKSCPCSSPQLCTQESPRHQGPCERSLCYDF